MVRVAQIDPEPAELEGPGWLVTNLVTTPDYA